MGRVGYVAPVGGRRSALREPRLRDVAFGVVAPAAAVEQTVRRLDELPGSRLDPRARPAVA